MYLNTQVSVKENENKLTELFHPSFGIRQGTI